MSEGILDRSLARVFHALGFERCSQCYVRVRRAQLLWFVTRRTEYRRVGWPDEFELRLVAPLPAQEEATMLCGPSTEPPDSSSPTAMPGRLAP